MKILLLSAYDAQSHRYWRESLIAEFDQYQWTVLTLAPRFFSYRVRANPMTWFAEQRSILAADYDLIIATSMVDMATLKGLIPSLAATPLWLYCHENQFSYPLSNKLDQHLLNNLDAKMVFLYNCLAAKQISFNSEFNRSTAIHGLETLLKKFPEKIPVTLIDEISAKAHVLAVPLQPLTDSDQLKITARTVNKNTPLKILWNHRWEYDKGPELLLAIVERLADDNLVVELNIVGQQFRKKPEAFSAIKKAIEQSDIIELGRWGFVESLTDYRKLLIDCDIVLSTALHDFQGLAVLEAVQAGCIPLLPDHLVYPEIFPSTYLYRVSDDREQVATNVLERLRAWQQDQWPSPAIISDFEWKHLYQQYLACIKAQ